MRVAADALGLFTVAWGRRVKAYDILVAGRCGRECVTEVFFALASNAALSFAVQVQQIA
jgi:hypothetical protein